MFHIPIVSFRLWTNNSEKGDNKPIQEQISQNRSASSQYGHTQFELGRRNPLSESTMTKLANPIQIRSSLKKLFLLKPKRERGFLYPDLMYSYSFMIVIRIIIIIIPQTKYNVKRCAIKNLYLYRFSLLIIRLVQ